MQDVHPAAGRAGEADDGPRGVERAGLVAPQGMAGDVAARLGQRPPLAQPRLVLAMHGHAAAAGGHHPPLRLHSRDQQVAGRGAHEHLDAAAAGQRLERGEGFAIVAARADIVAVVAPAAPGDALELAPVGLGVGDRGPGVGHVEHAGDAAGDGGAGAGFEILLVLEPGLAEMHLGVDEAGQDVQAGGVDRGLGRRPREVADGGDAPAAHGDVGALAPGGREGGAAADQQVEAGHRLRSSSRDTDSPVEGSLPVFSDLT